MNLNKVFLIGNLTQDVDLRFLPSGTPVAQLRLATNRFFTDQSGQKREEAEYHSIVAWGKLAELCKQHLAKGRMIFVEGRLRTRSWQDAQGAPRNRTEIIAESIQFGPRPKSFDPGRAEITGTEKTSAGSSGGELPSIDVDEGIEGEVKSLDATELPY